MQPRLDAQKIAPQAYRAMAGLETYVRNSGLEPGLLELLKVRTSHTAKGKAHSRSVRPAHDWRFE